MTSTQTALVPRDPEPTRASRADYLTFPGAFKNSVLVPPVKTPGGFEPVTEADVKAAALGLGPAINTAAYSSREFKTFLNAAMKRLALSDPSGHATAIVDGILCELYKRFEQLGKTQTSSRLAAGGRLLTDGEIQNILQDLPPSGLQQTAPEHSKSDLVPVQEWLSLLHKTLDLVVRSYAQAVLEIYGDGDREQRTKLSADLKLAATEMSLSPDRMESARLELLRQSKGQRVLCFATEAIKLQHAACWITERLQLIEQDFPAFPPKLLITCAEGDLFERSPQTIDGSLADDATLYNHTFIRVSSSGIVFSMMVYDARRGYLHSCHSDKVQSFESLLRSTPPSFSRDGLYVLPRLVNLFPTLDSALLIAALPTKTDTEFNSWLEERHRWFGPRSMQFKSWLNPGTSKPALIELLKDVTEVLSGRATKLENPAHLNRLNEIRTLFFDSYLRNTEAESFLMALVTKAIKEGTPLKDVVLEHFGKLSAVEALNRLWVHERIIAAPLLFCKAGSGVKLSEQGVDYILKLIDPAYLEHNTGSDSIELTELNTLQDRLGGSFDLEAQLLKRYGSRHPKLQ